MIHHHVLAVFPIGATIAGFAAVPILPVYGWRGVFVLRRPHVPLVLAPVLAFLLPESIRHLVIHGNKTARVRHPLTRVSRPHLVFGSATYFRCSRRSARPACQSPIFFGKAEPFLPVLLWIGFFMSLVDIYLSIQLATHSFSRRWNYPLAFSHRHRCISRRRRGRPPWLSAASSTVSALTGSCRSLFFLGAISVAFLGYSHSIVSIMICTFFAGAGVQSEGKRERNALAASFYPTYIRSTGVGWALGIGRIGFDRSARFSAAIYALDALAAEHDLLGSGYPIAIGSAAIFLMGRTCQAQEKTNVTS